MTWTCWGRPSCSSRCPRSPNKCGGEGTPWLARREPSLSPQPAVSPGLCLAQTHQGEAQGWFIPGHHGCRVPPCASTVLGLRGTAVTKGGAGSVRQSMEFKRERRPGSHRPSPRRLNTRERRKAQEASSERDTEPKWTGGGESKSCPFSRGGDQSQRVGEVSGTVRKPSLSCPPDPLATSQCIIPQ